jgi:hypothetical protein
MERRKWVPDVVMIADQLIADYRDAAIEEAGNADALHTIRS